MTNEAPKTQYNIPAILHTSFQRSYMYLFPDLDSWCWVLNSVPAYSKSNIKKTQRKIYTHPFLNILVNYFSREVQENHTQSPSHAAKEMKWDLSHLRFGIPVNETRFIKIDIVHTYILHYQWIKLKSDMDTDPAYLFLLQNTEINYPSNKTRRSSLPPTFPAQLNKQIYWVHLRFLVYSANLLVFLLVTETNSTVR